MATNRQRSLPTLRITAEQLRERAAEVCRRRVVSYKDSELDPPHQKSGEIGEGLRNEYSRGNSFASTPTRVQSYRDIHSQLMPTPPRAASSGNIGSVYAASKRSTSRPSRGRGQRRHSQTRDKSHSRSGSLISDSLYTDQQLNDTVVAWKKHCSGEIEKLIASWSQSRTSSKLMALLDTVGKFQTLSENFVLTDLETSMKFEVCSRLWKYGHYPVIEIFRKIGDEASSELDKFLQSAEQFYTSLLTQLQSTYQFTLADYVAGKVDFSSKTRQRVVVQAVSLCQYCYISLGDLSRYSQQLSDSPNWGKPRIFYLKARDLAPKDGKPYNQLAVVALNTVKFQNRRLDAIYYYMRSLMAKNPFKSAHDSLVGLFEDTSTKAQRQKEEEERSKVKAEKAAAKRQKRHHRKRDRQCVGSGVEEGGEIWIMPGCGDEGMAKGLANESTREEESSMDSLTRAEVLKKLVSTFLLTHGKLFTKIGIEKINSTLSHLTHALSLYLSHTPTHDDPTHTISTSDTQRLLQMMTINIFSIHHAIDSHTENQISQQFYGGLSVTISLKLTTILLRHCENALEVCEAALTYSDTKHSPADVDEEPITESQGSKVTFSVGVSPKAYDPLAGTMVTSNYSVAALLCVDRLSILLPSVRVWFQWVWHQRECWREWISEVDKSEMVEFWTATCSFLNLSLTVLPDLASLVITAVANDCLWQLWEDRMLAGFLPLGGSLSTQDTLSITDLSNLDQKQLREQVVQRIADIGRLCTELSSATDYGLTFDLATVNFDVPEQVSDLIKGAPPPREDDLSSDEDDTSASSDDVIIESSDEESGDNQEETKVVTKSFSEIELLKAQKERLKRKMKEQSQALQSAKNLLEEVAKTEQAVRRITPKYLVADTNCFVDMLDSIERLIATTQFVIAMPLVVITELEGLSKGAGPGEGQCTNAQAATGSRSAVKFVKRMFSEKCACVKALTTQGSLLSSLSFRAEVTDKASNDNLILESCLQLHSKVDSGDRHSVVLLTDDRNLRVKAHVSKLPVRDMLSFMKLLPKANY